MNQPLKLKTTSNDLKSICRRVESIVTDVEELQGLVFDVELLPDFDSLPEASTSSAVKESCAAYRRSTQTIYVNARTFFCLETEMQQAALAHEMGHGYAHAKEIMSPSSPYSKFGEFGEEFLADRLACKWGFFEGVKAERLLSYKQEYVSALEQWPDESTYLAAMRTWHIKKLAGLV